MPCLRCGKHQWQTANIFNLWYYIVITITPCRRLGPSGKLNLFSLRHRLSSKPHSPFHIWLPPLIVFFWDAHCSIWPVQGLSLFPGKMPWMHIHEFPLICHTLKGLSHYRIIERSHISPVCFFWIRLPAGPFSWNVIYMASEELSQTELTLHEGPWVIHMHYWDSRRQKKSFWKIEIWCHKEYQKKNPDNKHPIEEKS